MALDEGEWLASCPAIHMGEKKSPHWIGGLVGLGASPDGWEKQSIFCPSME